MLLIFDFLQLQVSKSTGEFVLVHVLVLRIMYVSAVWPCAARGPPEETLLAPAATEGKNNFTSRLNSGHAFQFRLG